MSNTTIVGRGTAGTPNGGVLTVQGDAAGTPIPVTSTGEVQPANNTSTTVAQNAAAVTLDAADANRKGLTIYNNSTSYLWIKRGAGAAVGGNGCIPLVPASAVGALGAAGSPGGTYELNYPVYTGIITGIWEGAGAGSALISKDTP